jgi:hypothetical protein
VNLVQPLLAMAGERPSVADSFRVSIFHLKLNIFAAFEVISPLPAVTGRILVVNVDLEKYRGWGGAFQCSLLRALCRLVWEGNLCFTQRWRCTHVCLAGSFFFFHPRLAAVSGADVPQWWL